jgi:hypothetical protein
MIEELLADDPNYLQWPTGQEWFRTKFVNLHQVIINRGAEPEETPEHNALQVLFLDDAFCLAFMRAALPTVDDTARQELNKRRQWRLEDIERRIKEKQERAQECEKWAKNPNVYGPPSSYLEQAAKHRAGANKIRLDTAGLHSPVSELEYTFKRTFELQGIDVLLEMDVHGKANRSDDVYLNSYEASITVEIKPVVGDDYPAVLRQMPVNKSTFLFLEQYTGRGATREQFIKTFASTGITVVFLNQIMNMNIPGWEVRRTDEAERIENGIAAAFRE